jgi:uncharacterized membrane protein YtjA (UPF0391 family)
VALAFLVTTVLWSFDLINDKASFVIGIVLFVTDWLAEMYDPHPEKPGPWFASHFHRVTDETSNAIVKIVIIIFIVLITTSIFVSAETKAEIKHGLIGSPIMSD